MAVGPVTQLLLGFPLSVVANFTPELFHYIIKLIKRETLEDLFFKAFANSLKTLDKKYAGFLKQFRGRIKKKENRLRILEILASHITYDKTGDTFKTIQTAEFRERAAAEIVKAFSIDDNFREVVVLIIMESLENYKTSFLETMSQEQGMRLIFNQQLLNTEELRAMGQSLETLSTHMVSRKDMEKCFADLKQFLMEMVQTILEDKEITIEKAGQVVIQGVKGDVIFSKEQVEEIEETILFLRITKEKDEEYRARLDAKSEISKKILIKTLVEDEVIRVDKKLFLQLEKLAKIRKSIPHTRKTGDTTKIEELIELEKKVGIEIYRTFFPGEMGRLFEDFFSLLSRSKLKLDNLVLVISSSLPEILNIPFEMIQKDAASDPFLLSRDNFLLTHTIEASLADFDMKGVEPLPPPLRMLFVSALPVDLPEDERLLEIEREQELLIEAVGDLVSQQRVLLQFLDIATLEEIERSLSKGEHHIVHFSGHGAHIERSEQESRGVLYLENEDGSTSAVTGEDLAGILKKYSSIRLVVLSACETARAETYGVSGALIKEGIPAVLGMHYPVGDRAATTFTSTLYEKICKGETLCRALFAARSAVYEADRERAKKPGESASLEDFTSEWMTPFLYVNQYIGSFIDHSKEPSDTRYFFQKPLSRLLEGGKYVGEGFIGRRKEIIGLTNLLRTKSRSVCIYGQGGIGKTTLAIRFADNFENGTYKIIQFRDELTEEKILTGLANEAKERLGEQIIEIIHSPDFSSESKINILIDQYLSREKVILLFDNFEENQVESRERKIYQREIHSPTLKSFLAHLCGNLKKNSYILFTTRYLFSEPAIRGFNLGEMRFSDTFKLINRFDNLVSLGVGEKRQVHRKLGGHPRALELLDGCLKDKEVSWESLSSGFKDVEEKEINHDLLLDMLWEKLEKNERLMLKAASVFRGMAEIKALAAVTGEEIEKIEKILISLNALSLVYLEENLFNIHRLTASFVNTTKMEEKERKRGHILAAEYFAGIRTEKGEKYLNNDLEARWHFLEAGEWDRAAEITFLLEDHLTMTGYPQLSFELLSEISDKGVNEKNRAFTDWRLGSLYTNFGDYQDALSKYEKCRNIFEKIGDKNSTAGVLIDIGNINFLKGNYDKALIHYKESLKISEDIDDKSRVSASLHQIGNIYYLKSDYDSALKHYEKALEISEKMGDIKGVSSSYHQIGMIYHDKGDYDSALNQYEKALEISEKIGDIAGMALSFGQMGTLHLANENFPEALRYFIKAFLIFAELGSPTVNQAIKGILSVKEKIPEQQFAEILKEFDIPADQFNEKDEKQEFVEFFFNITKDAVNAKEKSPEEKEKVIQIITQFLADIPGEQPVSEGFAAYFQMLLAYIDNKDIKEFVKKIPEDLNKIFEHFVGTKKSAES